MLYLLWALINIGLFLFFIFICFRATKLIREKLGLLASIVFVFGLLSFIGHSSFDDENLKPNSNERNKWEFISSDKIVNGTSDFKIFVLEKTLISNCSLGISYGQDANTKIITPVSASSWTTGFISGTLWIPSSILVAEAENGTKFQYQVEGVESWKLLGFTVFNYSKKYKGLVDIK